MLKLLTGRSASPASRKGEPASTLSSRPTTVGSEGSAARKHLLAVVLKETLLRNQLPAASVGIEFFRTLDRSGARTDGIHVRLIVRQEPASLIALERDFRRRLALMDYRASDWLQGVSWQFDLADGEKPKPRLLPSLDDDAPRDDRTFANTEPAPM